MMTRAIGLFEQICLALFLACVLNFILTSIAFAEIGNSKSQIEEKYGESIVSGDGKAYGYMTTDGEINITTWIEYNKQNRVVKETVLIDGNIKIRNFKKHFDELYRAVAAPDSAVFVMRTFSQEHLGVIVRKKDNTFNLIRFSMDNLDDNTAINMHSKICSFEIVEIAPQDVKKYLERSRVVQLVSNVGGQQARPGGTWLRRDNYFQSELFFSENLVPRKQTDMITIHHTAIEDMLVADIHELHLRNGWAGIAYHKVLLPNGVVEDGRPVSMIGAHALGVNPRSVGIVLVGNFEITPPSSQQMDVLVNLTLELMEKYHIPLENIVAHRDVTPGTTCPGKLFPWEEFLQRVKNKGEDKSGSFI